MEHRDALLAQARDAYGRSQWAAARSMLQTADTEVPLEAEDLERLAWTCRWESDPVDFLVALERAELAFVETDERAAAARMALEQARQHAMLLDSAMALTSFVRATEYLDGLPECAEHAQAQSSLGLTLLSGGDLEGARAALLDAREIARRVGSPGMEAMAVQGLAHLAVTTGELDEVLQLLDEAGSLAMQPGVAPVYAGSVYCSVISVCRALCDWERATAWTKVSTRYCQRESIAGYTGLCRFHQSEIDRLHGHLAEAEQRVQQACEELLHVSRISAGWGFSELAEICVRCGDLDGAEEALAEAVALGDDGQPGHGRLLLARGDAPAAARSLRRSLADEGLVARERRVFLLPVYVSACVAAGDEQGAIEGVAELEELARRLGTRGPAAAASVARGQLALHRGDSAAAIAALREGVRAWSEVEAPYEAAETRVLLARALTADGDAVGARLELRAATKLVEEFGLAVALDVAAPSEEPVRATRTFMFSDIVDSTRLSEAIGDAAWEPLLQWHDRTLRAAFQRWNGEEVKHGGDGFFVAFDTADDGVACAVEIQRALARHRAAHGFALSVRIGLHVGEATARDDDYFGSAVVRAARVSASAGAGEVLATAATLAECVGSVRVSDARVLALKGIDGPVVAGLVAWDGPAD
ncbi:MAG: adenylate/guanylate cyclase domain-containing protein [Actinomycetes bacterium]